jgi:hypothetical protein
MWIRKWGAAHPPPPPELTPGRFTNLEDAIPAADVSPELRKWLVSHLAKMATVFSPDQSESESGAAKLLDGTKIFEIPTKNPASRLYVLSERKSAMCGATGNCPIQLVEVSARGVHLIAEDGGWGFYANPHRGLSYPDIFIVTHMSAREATVNGYANVAGEWGLLYCGEIVVDKRDVHVCR